MTFYCPFLTGTCPEGAGGWKLSIEDREKELFFKEAVKEVSFLVLVHDRTLERPRLVKASLDGAVGRAGQLSEVFANTLRFKDGDTADGLALLGRLAFDASKLNPYAGVEWDKKTHIASFFNDTPLASAFSDGTDEKELEDLYNLLVGTLHRCVHGSTGFVPTKAELLRLRRFVCGEEGRLDADEVKARAKVEELMVLYEKRQKKAADATEAEAKFNASQLKEL